MNPSENGDHLQELFPEDIVSLKMLPMCRTLTFTYLNIVYSKV